MKKRAFRQVTYAVFFFIVIFLLFTGFFLAFTGYDIAGVISELSAETSSERAILTETCREVNPGETRDFYIDPDGVCARCSDAYSGTINRPWCTLERALNQAKTPHVSGGDRLYLREGIHRYDGWKLHEMLSDYAISGTSLRPTTISGYPGEHARIYGSVRVDRWKKQTLADGSEVWEFDWLDYVKKNYPKYIRAPHPFWSIYNVSSRVVSHIPQTLFIDAHPITFNEPFILKHANEKNVLPQDVIATNVRQKNSMLDENYEGFSSYSSMPRGYIYYENKQGQDFGKIFLKLPEALNDKNPNTLPIEIPLSYFGFIGPYIQDDVLVTNLSFRFSNGFQHNGYDGGATLRGDRLRVENVDISYHTFIGLTGGGVDVAVKNSTITFNGNTGSSMHGDRVLYDGNLFKNNTWRPLTQSGQHGGMKLIPETFNFTIRNNIFQDNGLAGLWLDYTGDGCAILQFSGDGCVRKTRNGAEITWNNYVGAGHLIENNVFLNDPFHIETSPGSEKNPIVVRNNFFTGTRNIVRMALHIHSSPYVVVENNIFSNLDQGVVVQAAYNPTNEMKVRSHQNNVRVSSNVFLNVSFPITFGEESSYNQADYPLFFEDNVADNNVFYGTKKPNSYFRFVKNNLDAQASFTPITEQNSFTKRQHVIDKDFYEKTKIGITRNDYEWFQARSLEQLEATPYFSLGVIHPPNPVYREWSVYTKLTLPEWQTQTKNDLHSSVKNPSIAFSNNVLSVQNILPSILPGTRSVDLRNAPLPAVTARLASPEERQYREVFHDLSYTYRGLPLLSCWYSLDSGVHNTTLPCFTNLSQLHAMQGANTWSVFLQDELLRVHALIVYFGVDNEAPIIRATSVQPPSPVVFTHDMQVNFSAEIDDAEAAAFVIDGAPRSASLNGAVYIARAENLQTGEHSYWWEARDALGNTFRTNELKYLVNPPKPFFSHLRITYPKNNSFTNLSTLELNYTLSEDARSCMYSLNGGTRQEIPCGENISELVLPEGLQLLKVFMQNATAITEASVTLMIDRAAPVIAFAEPTPSDGETRTNMSVIIATTVSDANLKSSEIGLFNSTSLVARGVSLLRITLPPEHYRVLASASDKAGNGRLLERQFTVIPVSVPASPQLPQPPSSEQSVPTPSASPPLQPLQPQLPRLLHVQRFSPEQLRQGIAFTVPDEGELNFVSGGQTYAFFLTIGSTFDALLTYRGVSYALALGELAYLQLDDTSKSGVTFEIGTINLIEHSISGKILYVPPASERATQEAQLTGQEDIPFETLPLQEPAHGGSFLPVANISRNTTAIFINESTDVLPENVSESLTDRTRSSLRENLSLIIGALFALLIFLAALWYFIRSSKKSV